MAQARDQHRLERRAEMLAGKIKGRVATIRGALVPAGARVPFTEQLSKPEALKWWRENIDTPQGQTVLKQMDPMSQIDLRRALGTVDEPALPLDAGGAF